MYTPSVVAGRRWLSAGIAALTIAGAALVAAPLSRADDAVVIPDAAFRACLEQTLEPNKAPGEAMSVMELATITDLSCDESGIADLTGAKYLTNVIYVHLAGNQLTTVADLKDLGNIQVLNVARNRLTGVKGIGDLTKITDLDLSENAITSIEGLEDIDAPQVIDVSSNRIADLSPLKKFTTAAVYADGQAWELAVKLDVATEVTIKGRSGEQLTVLTPAETWPSLTIAGAKVTASEAGYYDLGFTDPDACAEPGVCEYSFNGTVTVVASAEFTATPAPSISGRAAVGKTLTAVTRDWTPVQLDWTYQWYRNDEPIPDAVTDTYVAGQQDAGARIRVEVTGIRTGYAAPAVSSPSVVVSGPDFSATPAPTISGTPAIGQTLTAAVSGWSPTPEAWAYQWYRNDDTRIAGAVAATYVVAPEDAGSSLRVEVTGTKSGYAPATVTSASTAKVPGHAFTRTTRPTISGKVTVGRTLTARVTGWSPVPTSWTYQWYRNGVVIPGATAATYVLSGPDAATRITVAVTGIKTGFAPTSRTSSATAKVAQGTFHTTRPILTGTAQVGQTLTATAAGWAPTVDRCSYRWYRNGKRISHAGAATYTLVGSDAGKKITVRMTGVKAGYTSAHRTSAATRKVLQGRFTAAVPTIAGDPRVGNTLTVTSTGWTPTPSNIHRQWYRDGHRISHATAAAYRLTALDLGHTITARVTGTRKGYVTLTVTTAGVRAGA